MWVFKISYKAVLFPEICLESTALTMANETELQGGRGREREREAKRDHDCRPILVVFFNYLEPNEVFALSWELPCNYLRI